MRSRWAFRAFLFVGVVGVLWLAAWLTQSPQLVISERDRDADERADESMAGENVVYREYDLQGNQKIAVDASRGRQLLNEGWQLEGSKAQLTTSNGRVISFYSDRFREEADGSRVIESTSEKPIRVEEEQGMAFRTMGPMFLDHDEFRTHVRTDFEWGLSFGHAAAMIYRPGALLELRHDVLFQVQLDRQELRILANTIIIDLKLGLAEIQNGVMTVLSESGADVSLRADRMLFLFKGDERGSPKQIQEFHGLGADSLLDWRSGSMRSNRFVLCFGPQGRWVEWAESTGATQFSVMTEDKYRLQGRTGSIELEFQFGEPDTMTSHDVVEAQGIDAQGSIFQLDGQGGLVSIFRQGRAVDTLILGDPNFSYLDLKGKAGLIRLLHQEARILLSAGASLRQGEGTLIEGEDILIANWNLEQKEVFARRFVRFTVQDENGLDVVGEGDQVTLLLPGRDVTLLGTPAEFRQGSDILRAQRVDVTQNAEGGRVLKASHELVFEVEVGGQMARAEANDLVFDEGLGTAIFKQVRKAELPGMGEVAAREMTLVLSESRELMEVRGQGEIVIQGQFERNGKLQPFSCQADSFVYFDETGIVNLNGSDGEVVLHFDEGQTHRSRQLTFNLLDGSMHAGSDTHEFSKTILNIKDKNQGDKDRRSPL